MNFSKVVELVGTMGSLQFFPSDTDARLGIVEDISDLTHDIEKIRWLVKRMRQLFVKWPGSKEMRAVYCNRYRPDDGVEAHSELPQFSDGYPADPAVARLQLDSEADLYITDGDKHFHQNLLAGVVEQSARRRADILRNVKPATDAEIAAIKAEQESRRKVQA